MNSKHFLILFIVIRPGTCQTSGSDDCDDATSCNHADILYRRGHAAPPPLPLGINSGWLDGWLNLSQWRANTPGQRRGHAATHLMVAGADGKMAVNMILYGGYNSNQRKEYDVCVARTWIYTLATNSWRSLCMNGTNSPRDERLSGHSFVTLCDRTAFLFGGATMYDGERKFFNDTWSFSGHNESWHLVATEADVHIAPRSYHAAVSVHQRLSNCKCQDSMLVFGGGEIADLSHAFWEENQTPLNDLWELRCVNENYYKWFQLGLDSSTNQMMPSRRYKPATASQGTIMYIFGGCNFGKYDKLEICLPLDDMWQYSTGNNTWTRLTYASANWSPVEGLLQGAFVNNENFRGILLCCKRPFRFYVMESGWLELDTLDTDENYASLLDPSVAVVNSNVLVYGGGKNPTWISQDNLWNITMLSAGICLLRNKPQTPLSPPFRGNQVAVVDRESNMIIMHGGLQTETMFFGSAWGERNSGVWILDMHSLSWSIRRPKTKLEFLSHAGVLLFHPRKVLVVFGGVKIVDDYPTSQNLTWGYYPRENVWRDFGGTQPEVRRSALAAAITNQTMLMMGGISPRNVLCDDMWIFKLGESGEFGNWTKLDTKAPSLFGQSISFLNGSVFLYGGAVVKDQTVIDHSDTLWEFNIDQQRWQSFDYTGNGPGPRCFHSATGSGEKLVVVGGCRWNTSYCPNVFPNFFLYDVCILDCVRIEDVPSLWYFSLTHRHWTEMAPIPSKSMYMLGNLLLWGDDYLLALGGYYVSNDMHISAYEAFRSGFLVTLIGCPAGTEGEKFWDDSCNKCLIDQFSPFRSSCKPCPDGLISPEAGATNIENCSVCKPKDYCGQGVCYVPEDLIAKNRFERRCRCNRGFSLDARGKCVIPTAFLATFFSVGVIAVVTYVIFVAVRNAKRNRISYKRQCNQVKELTQVWKIKPQEITLKERIDGDSPGGFGEVYKAEYREMTVAVKRLQEFESTTGRYAQEFDREIEMMKTLRHPNIVMFFGGGRFEDNTPFLVVEYMPRGSLGALLRNKSFQLGNPQKRSFALNAAEGMAFLHGLKPARIHRDLKSFNLLVSDQWVVKVADFGAARLAQQEGVNQRASDGNELPTSLHSPLLEADALMSANCGSLLWTAPEILRCQDYGTPIDVYSFGIVLWEIWQRELPYYDYDTSYMHQVRTFVCNGSRPTIPSDADWPCTIISLMRSCWQDDPVARPKFSSIVLKLQDAAMSS